MAELPGNIVQRCEVLLSVCGAGNAIVVKLKLHPIVDAGVVGVDGVVECVDLSLLVCGSVHGLLEVSL